MTKIASLDDIERLAHQKLDKNALDYYSSGAQDELTLRDNIRAFDRYQIRPRVLRDVSCVNTDVKLFGNKFASPIFIAPAAMQKMAHPEGEKATVRAAFRKNIAVGISTMTTTGFDELWETVQPILNEKKTQAEEIYNPTLWFQLYVYKDRARSLDIIRKAERNGFTAVVVTVDTPVLGRRLADIKNEFALPPHLSLANFTDILESESDANGGVKSTNISMIAKCITQAVDPSLTWEDMKWLKRQTKLPVLVKGVLTAQDAVLAVEHGMDGIVVSNHGGRQLDTAPATIDALAEVAEAVNGRIPVLMDGGVRRGTDVFKALALGAKGVFLGRPNLWGLAYNGEEGVCTMLDLINEEFRLAMALAGCTKISDINKTFIQRSPTYSAKL
ncbi:Hydroxyacid oxidase 1 [Zancudomyces culisetae]|uniref:Oxidase FUB9 n=1 Tax=Zancudomyces culisetae TaxID=1213189 RepID=A0A1R1PV71_ZANCU|nr:Hydroxyacid oxidase 1 [Zancudomyces culisetae]|eukprot:OMH84841.1 Hydroxyacid oxidase 1 [Zancudomyces culisetae]